jgi:hypothetical protein
MHRRSVVLVGLVVTLAALLSSPSPPLAQSLPGDTSAQCKTLYNQYIEALTRSNYPMAEAIFARFVRMSCSLP